MAEQAFMDGLSEVKEACYLSDIVVRSADSFSPGIKAHKLILRARSTVVKGMLASGEESLTVPDMNFEELDTFLSFLYTRTGTIPQGLLEKHSKSLYKAGVTYDIPHLCDIAAAEIIRSMKLDHSECLSILSLNQRLLNGTTYTENTLHYKKIQGAALDVGVQYLLMRLESGSLLDLVKTEPELVLKIMCWYIKNVSPE
ncbi:putative BTB/POZ domain-containing protein At2g40440 [Capsella rubella]|uniref:putative BTB/POZ domain-containing protein At2g40440 n=1 Tax=Capsella rubella TaxID=81985 RepID=UPI000CD598BE|nr:putative BTB/POZ domain-containing protein At2g40440 [Capsella rubella]